MVAELRAAGGSIWQHAHHAVYVRHSLIKRAVLAPGPCADLEATVCWARRASGTTASRVAPGSDGLAQRACPQVGDGSQRNHRIRQFRQPSHRRTRGDEASGWTAREAGPVREAV